jgi:hypothetical protein
MLWPFDMLFHLAERDDYAQAALTASTLWQGSLLTQ